MHLTTDCQNCEIKTDLTAKRQIHHCWIFRIFAKQLIGPAGGKISNELINMNSTINKLDLADIYRIPHQTTAEYKFFPSSHRIFPKTDHILSHNAHLTNFKK